jgi:hypothetical protein
MTVRAVKTIEKDEEILASFYDANVSVFSRIEFFVVAPCLLQNVFFI